MLIRPATTDDLPLVLPMVAKICAMHAAIDPAKFGFAPDPAGMYRRWLAARAADPRSVFLVAQADQGLAAFLVGTVEREIPIYTLAEYGFIHDLWVEENYRHEGIARQMTMLAVEMFTAMGVAQIRLDTAAGNGIARELFASCGFRESATEMLIELNATK